MYDSIYIYIVHHVGTASRMRTFRWNIRWLRRRRILFNFVTCVFTLQTVRLTIDIISISKGNENIPIIYKGAYTEMIDENRFAGNKYITSITNKSTSVLPPPHATFALSQLPPDLVQHTPLLQGGILASPWGNAEQRKRMLPKWNSDIRKYDFFSIFFYKNTHPPFKM